MRKHNLVREYLSKIGANGGKRCLETMTAQQRIERAKNAVAAREAKRKFKRLHGATETE